MARKHGISLVDEKRKLDGGLVSQTVFRGDLFCCVDYFGMSIEFRSGTNQVECLSEFSVTWTCLVSPDLL